jgi:hypothetical protein
VSVPTRFWTGLTSVRRGILAILCVTFCFQLLSVHSEASDIRRGIPYSFLKPDIKRAIERRVEPLPLCERDNPFSTPMYHLLSKGFTDGLRGLPPGQEQLRLTRNRPDWQEEVMKDWADLGLTSTLFHTNPTQWDDPHSLQQIRDYFQLSKKYGLSVAIRLGGDARLSGLEARGGWDLHPNNTRNQLDTYLAWVKRVALEGRGTVQYYIVGDELNVTYSQVSGRFVVDMPDDKRWSPESYMKVFAKISAAIKSVDPEAKVSSMGLAGLDWDYVESLFTDDFAKHGDAIAVNMVRPQPYDAIADFARRVRAEMPSLRIYSNGVGYVGSKSAIPNPPNPSYAVYDDDDQAWRVARQMIELFDIGWDGAPYYLTLRQWVLPDGTVAPRWYGIFGLADWVVSKSDNLTIKRYPAWYAYQTVSHIFYSRALTLPAPFTVKTSPDAVDFLRVYLRNDYELLIVLWNEDSLLRPATREVSIELPTQKYILPVQVSLTNYRSVTDVRYRLEGGNRLIIENVTVGREPVILRLVAEDWPEWGDLDL